MHGPRHHARCCALQLLYMAEIQGGMTAELQRRFWAHSKTSARVRQFAIQLAEGTLANQQKIDRNLEAVMVSWKLSRVSSVVRNILRLAVTEMTPPNASPVAIVIDEALELTRDFMDEESASFVNSVLDEYRNTVLEPSPDTNPAAEDGSVKGVENGGGSG